MWKFGGNVQFLQSFERFARTSAETVHFHKLPTPGNSWNFMQWVNNITNSKFQYIKNIARKRVEFYCFLVLIGFSQCQIRGSLRNLSQVCDCTFFRKQLTTFSLSFFKTHISWIGVPRVPPKKKYTFRLLIHPGCGFFVKARHIGVL